MENPSQRLQGAEKGLQTKESVATRLIPSAILAPSAHNTQPWRFKVSGNQVDILVDWDRHLEVSDPTLRQLYVSIGCAITNMEVAARHLHTKPVVSYFPEGQASTSPIARVNLTEIEDDPVNIFDDIFLAIEQRHTDRSDYDGKPLTTDEVDELPSRNLDGVRLITDKKTIKVMADLTEKATERTLSRKDFKEELSHWVRNNWTRQNDGMPGYAMGMPAPVSLLSSVMVRLAPIHKQEAPKTKEQMNTSSAVIVISTPTDTPLDWIKSGQLLEQAWLEAVAAGLGAMPQVAAVEAGDDIRAQLQNCLNTKEFPQSILRIGHSAQIIQRPTPRRSFEDCTK